MPCLFLSPMLLVVVSVMMTLWWVAFGLRGGHRRGAWAKAGVCAACGYALVGLRPANGSLLCPECGTEYGRRRAAATGRAGWMWAWPTGVAVLAVVPLTERWWYRAVQRVMDSEASLVIPNVASWGGLLAVVLVFVLSKRVRARERLALVIVTGLVQTCNAFLWAAWTGEVVANWG